MPIKPVAPNHGGRGPFIFWTVVTFPGDWAFRYVCHLQLQSMQHLHINTILQRRRGPMGQAMLWRVLPFRSFTFFPSHPLPLFMDTNCALWQARFRCYAMVAMKQSGKKFVPAHRIRAIDRWLAGCVIINTSTAFRFNLMKHHSSPRCIYQHFFVCCWLFVIMFLSSLVQLKIANYLWLALHHSSPNL